MRILVTGAGGQVGRSLVEAGAAAGHEIIAKDRAGLDLTDADALRAAIDPAAINGMINAAAYTAVDAAEDDAATAAAINADAPRIIAEACAAAGLPLVHYSTDYVFDGTGTRPYVETDPAAPLGVYGRTKREGEAAILASGANAAILRLAWVFSAHGKNFVKTMLRVGPERGGVRVVADQIGAPTPALDAARAGLAALEGLVADPSKAGVYHYAGDQPASWAGLAEAIFAEAALDVPVERIPTSAYPTPAARPAYSVLDSAKFEAAFGLPAADWRAGLAAVIATLKAEEHA